MRSLERIDTVLEKLKEYWNENPDLRLCQIISNLSYEISGNNDPFYVEDDLLLKVLEEKLDINS